MREIDVTRAIDALICAGLHPSPTNINRFLGRTRGQTNNINGRWSKWRRDHLISLGWTPPERHGKKWTKP